MKTNDSRYTNKGWLNMSGMPLIWRFAEATAANDQMGTVYYDHETNINMVEIDGFRQPLLTFEAANAATMTGTAVKREETDQDFAESDSILGTSTVTKAKQEETDSD